jgi:group I intron endonuclease
VKQAGIYKIQRIGADECYVGSSHWIAKRWATHRRELARGAHHAPRLLNAWAKHGAEAFEFVVLEACCGDGQDLKDVLVAREQAWMDRVRPCYNTVPAAGSTLGFKMPRELVERHRQQLLGRSATPEEAQRLRTLALGLKRSEATKEKLRVAGLRRGMPRSAIDNSAAARRGKPLSAERVAKLAESNRGRKHRPEVLVARRAALTPEIKERMGATFRGKKQSPEHVAKKAEAMRAYHQRRRDAAVAA